MKKYQSLVLLIGLVMVSYASAMQNNITLCQKSDNSLLQIIKLADNRGARCSDGSYCDVGFDYCCYINGTEKCVKSLSDCKDD